jgi:cytochrome c oxidase subunit 1
MGKKLFFLLGLAIVFNLCIIIWVQIRHLFVVGLNPFVGTIAIILFLCIAAGLGIAFGKRIVRWYNSLFESVLAPLFLLGSFIFLIEYFYAGWIFGRSTFDIQLHDTYYVIAGEHLIVAAAFIFLLFTGIYYFFSGILRQPMNFPMGVVHFGVTLAGAIMATLPMQYEGLAGMPRRYLDYGHFVELHRAGSFVSFETKMLLLVTLAQILFVVNMIFSAIRAVVRRLHPRR